MKSIGMHFTNRLEFALVSSAVAELMDHFAISSAPALLVRKLSGETARYNGDLNAVALSDFLQKFASETIEEEVNRCGHCSKVVLAVHHACYQVNSVNRNGFGELLIRSIA